MSTGERARHRGVRADMTRAQLAAATESGAWSTPFSDIVTSGSRAASPASRTCLGAVNADDGFATQARGARSRRAPHARPDSAPCGLHCPPPPVLAKVISVFQSDRDQSEYRVRLPRASRRGACSGGFICGLRELFRPARHDKGRAGSALPLSRSPSSSQPCPAGWSPAQ